MIIHDDPQGSDAWKDSRLGIPTSSNFSKIITSTGKPSKQVDVYANRLIAEYLCGCPVDEFTSAAMQEGTEREAEARSLYELETDTDVIQAGFITTDDGLVGTSVDGMVNDDGLVEIKNPLASTHVEYLLSGRVPAKYLPQVMGQMYVAQKDWCDFMSYYPGMPHLIVRVNRDEKWIATLKRELVKFNEMLDQRKAELAKRDIKPLEKAA